MMGGRLGVLAALLLMAPIATADARFPLQGDLQWSAAASVQGLLIPVVGQGTVLHAVPSGDGSHAPPLLQDAHAHLKLHSWVELRPGVSGLGALPVREWDLREAHVQWIGDVNGEDLVLEAPAAADGIQIHATACDLAVPAATEGFQYPMFGTSASSTMDWAYKPGPAQLQASCRMASASGTAQKLLIYGIKIRVKGIDASPEDILTGTWEEGARTAAAGFMQRRTQVLEVDLIDAPLQVATRPGELKVYADGFVAEGALSIPSSQGDLAWGTRQEHGDVQAVAAKGIFDLHRGAADNVVVTGRTAEAPGGIVSLTPVAGRRETTVAAAAAGALALLGALWFLFHKIDPAGVAEHPRRRLILDIVRADPGVGTNALARTLQLRWPGVAYHLDRLERAGHVVVRRVGGRTAVFPAAGFRGKELGVVLLRQGTPRRALDVLRATPGLDQPALAAALGIHQSQVSRVLKALRNAGLVQAEIRGTRTVYLSAPASATSGTAPAVPI